MKIMPDTFSNRLTNIHRPVQNVNFVVLISFLSIFDVYVFFEETFVHRDRWIKILRLTHYTLE